MPRILSDIRIQPVSPLQIRLTRLLGEPIRKQTPRRRITRTGKRLLKGSPRPGRIQRGEGPRIEQSRLRLLTRLRTGIEQAPQTNFSGRILPNGKLRFGHSKQQRRISSKRPIGSRLIMLERFLWLTGFQQSRPKPHPMLDSMRTVEISPRVAHGPIRIHQLRNGPRSSPPAARPTQTRQIDRKEIHETA